MKLFNFIIYYCLITCIITLFSTFANNELNYISIGISFFGIFASLISKFYKKENLLSFVLVWYLLATFLIDAVKFDLLFSISSNAFISIGKIDVSFRILYLIPSILVIIYYERLSLLSKKMSGTVHTETSNIDFGTKIEFKLNDFNGKKMKGITDTNINGENFNKIVFEKTKGYNKSIASIEIINENRKLAATIKLN